MEPYMQEVDILMLKDCIKKFEPKTVLEWGCGGSTVMFPNAFGNIIEWWYSIEHNLEYVTNVRNEISQNVTIHYFSNDYVKNFVTKRILTFADFVLIDGIYRKECMEFTSKKCKESALIFLHDTGRVDYHKWFDLFPYWKKLTDGRVPDKEKGGFKRDGLHIFSKSKNQLEKL